MPKRPAEADLLQPLVAGIAARRWVGSRSIFVEELPWSGRRVDLVALTSTKKTIAFELKLNATGRAIQQSSYNRLAFDLSYVVTAVQPTEASIKAAENVGVGVIVVTEEGISVVLQARASEVGTRLRQKVVRSIREAHGVRDEVLSLP
jgi:hypothetical protein